MWVALRPEKIALGHDVPANTTENGAAGIVTDIGYRGTLSLYKVRLDDGFVIEAAAMNASRLAQRGVQRERPRVAVVAGRRRRGADAMSAQ